MYRENVPFPVYDAQVWRGDSWDALQYGFDIDWQESMFQQISRLHRTVPRMNVVSSNCENSDYCNMAVNTQNSYLIFGCVENQDCMYGHIVWKCQDCLDCLYCYQCIRCYECIDCLQCHSLAFSRDCDNCSTSFFLIHCIGCRDCFGCVGLKNKQYYIFNEPHTKDEYVKKMAELNTGSHQILSFATDRVQALVGKEVVKYYHGFNCENVTGDYLYNCRNIQAGFDLKNSEDSMHCATGDGFIDCLDCNFCGQAPIQHCVSTMFVQGHEIFYSHNCPSGCARLWYCDHCFSCQDCFGCEGLKNKRYCILNKQYSKEEYERLVPQMKEHMKKYGEFGRYFPPELSPFAYNETIAFEYFPLTKEDVVSRGWQWYDDESTSGENYLGPKSVVPDDVRDASDDLTKAIFSCEASSKLYKILPQELQFYREMKLPLPTRCFMERQRARFAMRNPRRLWSRQCAKCQKDIQTTYAPERPEIVYCEECYLREVY